MMRRIVVGLGIIIAAAIAAIPLRPVWADVAATATPSHLGSDSDILRPVDTSINIELRNDGLSTGLTTAVVPIIGYAGSAATLRLAQVSGPQNLVARVKAVLEIDNDTNRGPWQFTALIPVSSIADRGRGHRVDGVGITGIITK